MDHDVFLYSWCFLVIVAIFWWILLVFGGSWWLLEVLGGLYWLMMIHGVFGDCCLFFVIVDVFLCFFSFFLALWFYVVV